VTAIIDITKNGFDIATNDKIIRFKQLQFPSKKMLNIADILNGKDLDKYIGYKIIINGNPKGDALKIKIHK
ncbi:hypothetical protein CHQ80_07745, partial [Francisella noatunensis subsp. orientalis]|nr:hypothetical protein [Francisella orientalis]